MSWSNVIKRIEPMIKANTYITQSDIDDRIRSVQYDIEHVTFKINSKPAENYRITDEHFNDGGGVKARFKVNIEAVKLLKTLEASNRSATPDEQEILAHYVGWGGLAQAFDKHNNLWKNEYAELKELLTPAEYESARGSVNNAHYTSPIVIEAIYKGLENLGFKSGKILEPSMGSGNFFGMIPPKMSNSKLYGVELDNITGRLAKQLYPNADISIYGFEKTKFPDNSFDVCLGNVPFGV